MPTKQPSGRSPVAMDSSELFNELFDNNSFKLGDYTLKSGLVAPYYINLRRLPLYPRLLSAVAAHVVDRYLSEAPLEALLSSSHPNASQLPEPILCGVPFGAVPLAAVIAQRANMPYLFERKDVKSYGDAQALVDGFNTHRPAADGRQSVILVEDVMCSGQSVLETVRRLEAQHMRVEFVVCIVDREENGCRLLAEQGVRVLSLYSIGDILRSLKASGRISLDQYSRIRLWTASNQFKVVGVNPAAPSTRSGPVRDSPLAGPTKNTTAELVGAS